jgi:hypothetical protein
MKIYRSMKDMDNNLESSKILIPLLHKKSIECNDSLNAVMEYWEKRRVQIVHLGENIIQMDN